MNKIIAIFFVAVGIVYSNLESNDFIFRYALPAGLILSLLYLFWLKGFLAIAAGYIAYHYMDFGSSSMLKAALLPVFIGICTIYFIWWLSRTAWDAGWHTDLGGDGDAGGDGGAD